MSNGKDVRFYKDPWLNFLYASSLIRLYDILNKKDASFQSCGVLVQLVEFLEPGGVYQ